MKKAIFFFSIMLGTLQYSNASDNDIPVRSEIKSVTVFLNSAQITRTASTVLQPGANKIVFEGLSQYINENSIQVKGTGDFTILSVSQHLDYMSSQVKSKEVATLEDSLESYNSQVLYLQSMLENYVSEKNMLIANQSIGGANSGVKIEELKATAEFFRTRLTDISAKYLAASAKITKINEKITKITGELSQLNSKKNVPTGEIMVTVTAKTKCTANFSFSYIVGNAGWIPAYDLRAIDTGSPITITHKANVYQTTGEEWNNINLILSTGNPSVNGTKPIIYPWYLYLNNYYPEQITLKSVAIEKISEDYDKKDKGYSPSSEATTSADYTTVSEAQTHIEYVIALPYTINSDGKQNDVEIQNYTLPATYRYYCAPKLDNDAFLIAEVSGWDQYNFQSGNINLYFEGTYVGKSYLNSKSTADTLELSLGRDKNISITRIKQKELTSKSLIGANRKEKIAWEINLRNKKKQEVVITIEDQVPISTYKSIEIENNSAPQAEYYEATGILKWKLNLSPSETKKISFSYEVKYPKDKVIHLE